MLKEQEGAPWSLRGETAQPTPSLQPCEGANAYRVTLTVCGPF